MKKHPTNETTKEIIRFNPSKEIGLNANQVASRIEDGLVNYSSKKYSKSYFSIFFENICTFFNLLGLIVALALIYAKAEIFDFVFVLVYLANLTIGIVQEIRAKISIDKLSLMSENDTIVIRDGNLLHLKSKDIVLDDIIKLGLGSQVPTDCVILDGFIEVNESLLTGESVPVKKGVGDTLLAGSFITTGTCTVKAQCVGKDNYIEKLSEKAKKHCLAEIVNGVIKLFEHTFKVEEIICKTDIPEDVQVEALPSHLYPALSNIISNSIYWLAGKEIKRV